ncbi:hypothetical protein SCHPADRAFT_837640 [Schizopora paradoxa]|uniref:Nucleolus and neural progenitor protein-like N-terminal domain-containing protein n=1 Tax=Schizopora paradoxa TaxID=27342 RepID=A0A0H2RPI7_9AGAM|nr:hypothetical protein SCHPADRAFT_837640 [Schizopora paradoxa]
MPTARHVKQPKIAPTARADIDVSFYGRVDAALKDLRTCSRQIGPVLLSMEDELRILDRLYYKGKNQHRLAKFWKKVEEMRRFGKRIVEMQLSARMDDLRYAFYGDGSLERNPSTLKKAWTQIPDVSYLSCMLYRVEGANVLVDEARRRFAGVNRSLLLMMQTGAFLQFIVTLTAIVSRLDALSQEIQEPLYSWKASLKSLISVMKVPHV